MPCRCGTSSATVEELLKCKTHFEGHTIIGCQVCMSGVCRLFFPETNSNEDSLAEMTK